MDVLLLKLLITPALVGAASLAGRRWGAAVGGWLVGIPFTSGPIALFLALGPGRQFAADVAVGILAGTVSQVAFALAYAWVARRAAWPASFGAAAIAFLVLTAALNAATSGLVVTLVFALGSLFAGLLLMPRASTAAPAAPLPWWDIPARMLVATVFVVALTEAAPLLGARLAGLLSPFPLYATVLAVFAHRVEGAPAALAVLRGLLLGLFAFAAFFVVIAALLVPAGIALAFGLALGVALAVQAASLLAGRALKIA